MLDGAARHAVTGLEHLEPKARIAEMAKSVKSMDEDQFAATRKMAKQFLKEKDKAWRELADRVAEQGALHLAKEAADKEGAGKEVVKNKKPSRLPQAHRRTS